MMWIPREIEKVLLEFAGKRPAVVLTGCRQAGKTSLLTRIFPDHGYVSLDLPVVAEEAEFSGQSFLARHPPPIIVDEVQYAPALLRYLKVDIDQHREDFGRYLITGSQKFPLMEGVTESLAGRASIINLHSLSAREFEAWSGATLERDDLVRWMFQGGYPELHRRDLDPERFYGDYVATYLERDVRSVLNVRSLRDFDRFMRLCAVRTGQLVSYHSLATDLGLSPNTVKSWLSVLEASNIVVLLEPYFENLGKRIIKTPKLFFLDTGLCCFLLGARNEGDLAASPHLGSIFETHVLGQLIRHFANRGRRPNIYFYRDHQGREVDFLIPSAGRFSLIECKWSETPAGRQRGFAELESLVGPDRILSKTVVSSLRGHRRLPNGVNVSDSIALEFLTREERPLSD
ncbi:MAG: ATP-binding protein [Thermoanaerobaculales bacterium]|nr:ATP-binding protein [Thermoanaerobaculales bacterium]